MSKRCLVLCCVIWLTACGSSRERGDDGPRDSGMLPVDSGAEVDASNPSADASATVERATPTAGAVAVDVAGSQGAAPAQVSICDRSNDIRLVWQLEDPIMVLTHPFVFPFGAAIIVLDGQCRFLASRDPRAGYATGTLSAEQASELSRELAFSELWSAGSPQYPGGGSDVARRTFTTSAGAVRCSGDCPPETPKAIADALLSNASRWLERMLEQGKPLTPSVVSALAIPLIAGSPLVAGGPKTWPLARSMDSVPNLKLTGISDPRWNKGPYARIEDAREIAALRALRESDLAANFLYATEGAQVTDGRQTYRVYVRDELPEDFAAQLRAFLARPTKRPSTP